MVLMMVCLVKFSPITDGHIKNFTEKIYLDIKGKTELAEDMIVGEFADKLSLKERKCIILYA